MVHRAKLISVLLQVEHDSRLCSGDVGELLGPITRWCAVFAASGILYGGIFLFEDYLGPLLGDPAPRRHRLQPRPAGGRHAR